MSPKVLAILTLTSISAVAVSPAHAGPYSDELGKCLVQKTSPTEKVDLVKWFFSTLSANSAVKAMSSVTPAQVDALDRTTASLFERLLIEDCRAESSTALKYEGVVSLEESFRVLGEVAARELMADPSVKAASGKFANYIDKGKLAELMKSAGLSAGSEK